MVNLSKTKRDFDNNVYFRSIYSEFILYNTKEEILGNIQFFSDDVLKSALKELRKSKSIITLKDFSEILVRLSQ